MLRLKFLAIKNDITKAMEDGYSVKTIFLKKLGKTSVNIKNIAHMQSALFKI
ncbi:MAG: TraK family protein [Enterovibrio sp.]